MAVGSPFIIGITLSMTGAFLSGDVQKTIILDVFDHIQQANKIC